MHSLIIPTFNRRDSLLQTLHSAINQSLPSNQYEIIVIDDGSTDDTEEQISLLRQGFGGRAKPEIRYFKIKNGGPAKARNKGIEESKGDIIFFTDDDCVVPHDWMETLLDGFKRHPEVVGVGGWFKPPEGEKRFFQKTAHALNAALNNQYLEREKIIDSVFAPTAFSANVAYKKNILIKAGGFDETMSALGSVELRYRILTVQKEKILSLPLSVVHHCPLGALGYLGKVFRQGRCKQRFNFKYFHNRAPKAFDVRFSAVFGKLPRTLVEIGRKRDIGFENRANLSVFIVCETILNAAGRFYEKFFSGKSV